MRKRFPEVQTIDQLNVVSDAQQAAFDASVNSSVDAAAIREERQASYLARWQEALAYMSPGATLLDIGSGWPIPRVWDAVVRNHHVNYHALDVSHDQIEETRRWLARFGILPEQAIAGSNTKLSFPTAHFDFVFSSHCLEHSTDLLQTFEEITRVLKPDGTLFYAVPFGFDTSNEHLLYFSIDEWVKFTELAGFKVINVHIGRIYAPDWDVAIVARLDPKRRDLEAARRLLRQNSKANLTFIGGLDDAFKYRGPVLTTPNHRILRTGAVAILSADDVVTVLFRQTEDCGVAELSSGRERKIIDLHSPFVTVGSVQMAGSKIKIRGLGQGRGGDLIIIEGALAGKHGKPVEDRSPMWKRIRRRVGRVGRRFIRI